MMPGIHARYIKTALGKKFLSPNALEIMQKAVIHSDALHNISCLKPQHISPDPSRGIDFINTVGKFAREKLISAGKTLESLLKKENPLLRNKFDKSLTEGLYAMGRLFHGTQDFLSHTNFINLEPSGKDLKKILTGKKDLPENLFACSFKLPSECRNIPGWFALKRIIPSKNLAGFLGKFNSIYEKPGEIPVSHFAMNLDAPGTMRDVLYLQKHGVSGFQRASKLAVKVTRDLFKEEFEAPIKEALGEQNRLMKTLQGWHSSDKSLMCYSDHIGEDALIPQIEGFIDNRQQFEFTRKMSRRFGNLVRKSRFNSGIDDNISGKGPSSGKHTNSSHKISIISA